MAFEWYAPNDTTPAGTANDLTTSAGTASAVKELHAWLNKGSSVGSPETRYLRVYVEDPDSPGTYKTSGLDILDRREFEVRIVGSQNPDGVVGFVCPTTAWTAIGTSRAFQLPAIYPNCCIEIEVRVNPTYEGGASSPARYYVRAVTGTTVGAVSIPTDIVVEGDIDMDGYGITGAKLSGTLDADGETIQDAVLSGATLGSTLDVTGQRITGLGLFYVGTDASDAASVGSVRGTPMKFPVLCMGDPEVVWDDVVSNGDFASDLTGWTGTNWAWDTGAALHTAGATAALTQDVTIVSGVRYKLTFSVGGATGTLTPSIGAVAGAPVAAGAGVTEQIIVAGASGTLALAFTPSSDFDGNVDDVFCTATLFGLPTMDGATPAAGDRVLLPMQSDPAECGKWIVSDTGPWVRHPDCLDHYYLFSGAHVWVRAGTTWAKSMWVQTATISDIETDTQTWELAYQIP